ncbi:hypothetical protein JX266_014139 [Neoarthrinium moseri]|nr:hypothetical protein JX266_014139 [Neoarthrinium moseri]
MRMRKLGQGQTVVFCIPDEIRNKILQHHSLSSASDITAAHILAWAICETFWDTKKSVPLWATQASNFYRQESYWQESSRDQSSYSSDWAERFLEDEAQTLDGANGRIVNLVEPTYITEEIKLHQLYVEDLERWTNSDVEPTLKGPQPVLRRILSQDEREQLRQQQAEYKILYLRYQTKRSAVIQFDNWLTRHVQSTLLVLASQGSSHPREVLKYLRTRFQGGLDERSANASTVYNELIRITPAQRRNTTAFQWYTEWEKARLDGERLNIPELHGSINPIRNFLSATEVFDKDWSAIHLAHLDIAIQTNSFNAMLSPGDYGRMFLSKINNAKIYDQIRKPQRIGNAFTTFSNHESPALENTNCPCPLKPRSHKHKPRDCNYVWMAVNGILSSK